MHCKNCESPLPTDSSFCSNCGAKVVHTRLTFKHIWHDVTERYFNLDNTFLKTFVHLFTKPEDVIEGYLDGVRKKYLNPISYLAIALTLTSILVFFMKRAFPEGLDLNFMGSDIYEEGSGKRLMDFTLSYYNVLFIIQIPIFALASKIAFRDFKKYYSEHVVTFMYTQAQYSITSIPVSLVIILFAPGLYLWLSLFSLALVFCYSIYVLKRLYKKGKFKENFTSNAILFTLLFGFGFVFLSIVQFIVMLIGGIVKFNIPA